MRSRLVTACLTAGISAVVLAAPARAEDTVTYEIVSNDIATVNLEYYDHGVRKALEGVPLPWRTDVTVVNAASPSDDGAEVRADWRPAAWPSKWVTVRIYSAGKILCQNTLDVGNATCYGSSPHFT